jgi:HAD superfamily hydrolase (TIGR01509 family)
MYQKYFGNKKAVFFDLDGTLTDTSEAWNYAFDEIAKELGTSIEPSKVLPNGYDIKSKWKWIIEVFKIKTKIKKKDLVKKTQEKVFEYIRDHPLEPKNGFIDLLYELKEKEYKTAVVTNSHTDVAIENLKTMGLDKGFDLVIGSDQVSKPKPSPAIYKKALRKLGLRPKDVLVFEDSYVGVVSSLKAGLDTICIWDEELHKYDYPKKTLDFFPDFSAFPGNIDIDQKEYIARELEKRETILKEWV